MPSGRHPFLGKWRIITTELWTKEDLDDVSPAQITFLARGQGELELLVIQADIDYRVGKRETMLANGKMTGRLFIHQGDESGFTARRESLLAADQRRSP
jgi:hypothetical protein